MKIILDNSIQPTVNDREPNSIHPIRLQLVLTSLIETCNLIDQFENIYIPFNKMR